MVVRKENAVHIKIEPELSACVETQARREYQRILGDLLGRGGEERLAAKLEILRSFLESADFSKLRSESEEHLLAGRRVRFIVYLENGLLKSEMKIN